MSTSDPIPRAPDATRSTVARPSRDDDDVIGTVIDGRYRIDALVGRGGMGSVYRGEHVSLRRPVAVKLLHPTLAQIPEIAKRFEREAFAIGRIEHPNCVNVTDFGSLADGSLFLVMEYLEGISLGDLLDEEKRLEPIRALTILTHVLRGLGHAHAADIVHRDVKPENVLIVEEGGDKNFAKILDFGIAKLLGQAEHLDGGVKLTQAGVTFGTPIYMSPEQALGSPVDARADLYAASVMAFEMITGRAPFVADDKIEVLSMHTARDVPSFAEVNPTLEPLPGPEAIIRKGLAKRPADRFANAGEYLDAIDEVLNELRAPAGTRADPANRARAGGAAALVPPRKSRPVGTVPVTYADDNATTGSTTTARPASVGRGAHAGFPFKVIALAGAGLLGVVFFIAAMKSSSKHQGIATLPGRDASVTESATAMLDRGDPDAVIRALESSKAELADDPKAQLVLGHAYAAKRRSGDALAAYRAATDAAPGLAKDPKLTANLVVMFDEESTTVAVNAAEFLYERTKAAEAAAKLVAIAESSKDNGQRKRAADILERFGLSKKVNWLTAYTSDLVNGDTCKERQLAVAKLRALGNRDAIEVLEAARFRKGQTGKWRGKNVNVCMTKDIDAAINYLGELSPSP